MFTEIIGENDSEHAELSIDDFMDNFDSLTGKTGGCNGKNVQKTCPYARKSENRGQKHPRGNVDRELARFLSTDSKAAAKQARADAEYERQQQHIAERQFRSTLKKAGGIGMWKLNRESMLPVSDVRAGGLAVRREFEVGTFRCYAPRLKGERRGKFD